MHLLFFLNKYGDIYHLTRDSDWKNGNIGRNISDIIIKKTPVYKKTPPYLSQISDKNAQNWGFW